MNGVNINQFQFEYDLTWMAFFQNANGRTYVRYGGREDHHAESHLNKKSLLWVMQQALNLHKQGKVQPVNRYEPVARVVRTPEEIPTMKKMMAKRKESCIHCHDVKVAGLRHLNDLGTLRKDMVFTYPSPSRLGLQLDPNIQNQIKNVINNSPSAKAGIRQGDVLETVDGQRVLTLADVSRVLEFAPKRGSAKIGYRRDGKSLTASVQLPRGWRKNVDPSWRSSTGSLGPGSGFWGKKANDRQRKQLGIEDGKLAIRINFIWGKWTRQAGIKNGDVVVAIDGQESDMTIRQLQAYLHLNRNWGDKIPLVIRRGGKELKLTMNLPPKAP